jgi:hypothetical protein
MLNAPRLSAVPMAKALIERLVDFSSNFAPDY